MFENNTFNISEHKKQFGQFFTSNAEIILQGFEKFVENKNITDPFAGNADLINWAKKNNAKSVIGYDIDKTYIDNINVFENDSILNPQKYDFVLTNPPYLYINRASEDVKNKYFKSNSYEDLYQIAINSILNCEEGILIIPINFLSALNSREVRELFLHKFDIIKINYFQNSVFSDTTINVIALYFRKNKTQNFINIIDTTVFPDKKKIELVIEKKYSWTIGGEILTNIERQENILNIYRLEDKHIIEGSNKINIAMGNLKFRDEISVSDSTFRLIKNNIILLKAIDSGSAEGKISLENIGKHNIDALISKQTSRHQIQLIFKNKISIDEQILIIQLFNHEIEHLREKYFSLFFTNYRDNDRKRISFNFTYKLINYLYFNKIKNVKKQHLLF